MTAQELQSLKGGLLKQKAAIEDDLEAQGKTIEEWVELSERTFNFARYARMWFANGDMETRRAIFAALGSHLIIKGQKLNAELHPHFKIIFENLAQAKRNFLRLEPLKTPLIKDKSPLLWRNVLLCGVFLN